MNIAKRLLLLIAIAIAGLIVIAAVAATQMARIQEGVVNTNENSIPSILKLEEASRSFLRLRTRVLNHILTTDPAKMREHEQQLANYRAAIQTALDDYKALLSDDEDRRMLDADQQGLNAYYAEMERVIALSAGNRKDEARELIIGPIIKQAESLAKQFEAHIKLNSDAAAKNAADAQATYHSARIQMLIVALAVGAVAAVLGLLTFRHVAGSLNAMTNEFTRIERNLDFTTRIPVDGNDEVATASQAFNRLLDRLQGSLREVADKAHAVTESAGRVSTASEQMSIASSHQSESASSMAATMEEMTVSINHVADRAGEADELSRSSGRMAQEGTMVIGEAVSGIDSIATTVREAAAQISRLEQNSERVNSVVSVIKDVADQTNLLALNAAIEAARAGEQGRGFAVVADEVRKLAERTTQSTQEIAATISEMQNGAQSAVASIQAMVTRVEHGVSLAQRANASIIDIGNSSEQAVEMVGDISEAIREQSAASTTLAQEVEKIAQMSEENSAAAHSTSANADELAKLANAMQQVVAQYRI
ncbi:methyl-accepting chemotaxis protein [Azonexus sp. R2A61]|uniref:methyl-accepting chemotaxis protein n=1 Tax=Azonexus sp. R2A61 TaxID=2744443 RepID=UPI001F3D58F3|nr:methyl-accepting chemotaxis protein [Azonexus sp. R2A61]